MRVYLVFSLLFICACSPAKRTTTPVQSEKPVATVPVKNNEVKETRSKDADPASVMENLVQEIKRDVQGATTEKDGEVIHITFDEQQWGALLFSGSSATISYVGQRSLDKLSSILLKNKSAMIRIEGHTDDAGSAASNMRSSDMRANAVAQYLLSKGISPHRIMIRWYGESKPKAKGSSAISRSINRRIEIILKPDERVKGK